jgi:hypothetical protein
VVVWFPSLNFEMSVGINELSNEGNIFEQDQLEDQLEDQLD